MFCALFADALAPYSADDLDISRRLLSPSAGHWFGCDADGGDVLTSMLFGARTSLTISFLTVALSMGFGVTIGLISGYFGSWVDTTLMRLVDMLMAFPGLLVAMVLATALGPSTGTIILAISATGWLSSARVTRGQVLTLRERDYVMATRALGGTHLRLLLVHILPATLTPLMIQATFSLSGVIIVEAGLSFLGLGSQDGAPSWGGLLSQGQRFIQEAPHLSIFPGLAIVFIVLALNIAGDAIRDATDPKRRS